MQRLFATFPDGQPGAALLLLRLSLAGILVCHGGVYWQSAPPLWRSAICDGLGLLLTIGLLTPVFALGGAALGAGALFLYRGSDLTAGVFMLLVMAALGMLGAGAYSLDARLYGRREVIVPSRHDG